MPSNKDYQNMRNQYVARGVSNGNLNVAESAQSATVMDIEGKTYIDFAGAIGTLNVGHSHPKIVKHLQNVVQTFIHPGFNVIMYESYLKLAKKLSQMVPGDSDKKAILLNSGSEAVENAVKIARKYTGRTGVVTFTRGFHGRTNLTMAMTSKVKPYKLGFGPFAPEVYQAPYPDFTNKPETMTDDAYSAWIIAQFNDFFVTSIDPSTVACIVMEPVQGEGGFIIPDTLFVKAVREMCDRHGIVFVADEIQTGLCRTGKTFAIEHFDIEPDLMTISKSLAAGFPLSAVVGRSDIIDAPNPGELGGTFTGNHVACEAALKVLEIIEEENLNDKAEQMGSTLEQFLKNLQQRTDCIGDVRRLGAMVAMNIVDPDTHQPDKEKTAAIVKRANNQGLLLLSAGVHGNVIRFLTPLVITKEELSRGLAILEEVVMTCNCN